MKVRKIESLKKNVYLIDGYDDENDAYYYMSDSPILKRYRCLAKLKDLTEEQIEPLVEKGRNGHDELGYLHYVCDRDDIYYNCAAISAQESFLSALEAIGLHLNGNPFEKCSQKDFEDYCTFCSGHESLCIEQKAFLEAEQNVFSENTLVFVEQ